MLTNLHRHVLWAGRHRKYRYRLWNFKYIYSRTWEISTSSLQWPPCCFCCWCWSDHIWPICPLNWATLKTLIKTSEFLSVPRSTVELKPKVFWLVNLSPPFSTYVGTFFFVVFCLMVIYVNSLSKLFRYLISMSYFLLLNRWLRNHNSMVTLLHLLVTCELTKSSTMTAEYETINFLVILYDLHGAGMHL